MLLLLLLRAGWCCRSGPLEEMVFGNHRNWQVVAYNRCAEAGSAAGSLRDKVSLGEWRACRGLCEGAGGRRAVRAGCCATGRAWHT